MEAGPFQGEILNLFAVPARIIIAGFSNSGKSVLCQNIIEMYEANFHCILYCGVSEHPLESHHTISTKLKVSKEILNPFDYTERGVEGGSKGLLFVLDDCFLEASDNKFVTQAFTAGRHSNISVIFITQNVFHSGKFSRSISLNCSHYILMKNRDIGQIETLGRQLFGRRRGVEFSDIYKKALTHNRYGYLLVDFAPSTPELLQLRTNILGETEYQIAYKYD